VQAHGGQGGSSLGAESLSQTAGVPVGRAEPRGGGDPEGLGPTRASRRFEPPDPRGLAGASRRWRREDPQPRLPLSQQGLHLLNRQRREQPPQHQLDWWEGPRLGWRRARDRQMAHTLSSQRTTRQGESTSLPAIRRSQRDSFGSPLEAPCPWGPVCAPLAVGPLPAGRASAGDLDGWNSKFFE